MSASPASVERVQKYVFNFEIYRFVKKRPIYPILPYVAAITCIFFKLSFFLRVFRRAARPSRTTLHDIMPMQCTIHMGLHYGSTLVSLRVLDREKSLKNHA